MRTRVVGTRREWGQIEGTCDESGHVWTWTDDKLNLAIGEPLPEATCDCGAEVWRDHSSGVPDWALK